ncbi:50S ribosomal protein L1, mitochondrial, putative (RPL1) [Plasmodium ovale curtisi]|uniref:50S ribosomal protein L1, mitochondrial, putative (RPL1) n=1 Tax=Plasmodium ovale curtisi TaxID=864141 RepID=A0A1A8VMC2_PLAOA|nr:50S ribosomal protein L1, mitochondrial, putative (RPL1) [Plasmodium ovale curtisi]SBS80416.1 50S ribosomal protein L1, mitochondrial, putative (RPL1) [Plasmodium ovale curtisi]
MKGLFSLVETGGWIQKSRCCDKGRTTFLVQKRGRKYIPFYDPKKEKKKKKNEKGEDTSSRESTERKEEAKEMAKKVAKDEEKEGAREAVESRRTPFTNLMPAISPMKGVKLLLSFNSKNVSISSEKEEKVSLNLITRIDVKRESLRGMCNLAHSVDKNKKILVLVDEDNQNLKKYGAHYVGLEYINKIKNGWLDFDICITNYKNISKILQIAKILGPKKLMPNVKSNTLVDDLKNTIEKIKSGNIIEYRSEQIEIQTYELYRHIYNFNKIDLNSIAHINVPIASTHMKTLHILDNIKCFVQEIMKNNIHSSHTEKDTKPTFTWPPITSKKKKKTLILQNINTYNTDGGEDNTDSFILGGYITLSNLPKIFLNPRLLHPLSDGYSL